MITSDGKVLTPKDKQSRLIVGHDEEAHFRLLRLWLPPQRTALVLWKNGAKEALNSKSAQESAKRGTRFKTGLWILFEPVFGVAINFGFIPRQWTAAWSQKVVVAGAGACPR